MEWRPIETAPKDGKPILACVSSMNVYLVSTVGWNEILRCWILCEREPYEEHAEWWPTHWMPLPEPPAV